MDNKKTVLSVSDLSISFRTSSGTVRAVRNMDFQLYEGETLAIVGESGSGKSVTCKAITRILADNSCVESGQIHFTAKDGESYEFLSLPKKEMRQKINGKRIAMVFQDPLASLDPIMTIGEQMMEGMRRHLGLSRKEAWKEAVELLIQVGISDAEQMMKAYPHQLSGGMRQRVVIAIALSCHPDILICDEPTTALDVTIQEKILELIRTMQKKYNLSVIYITHDLAVVAQIADRVIVMYAGQAVEEGLVNEIFFDPRHPYTWGLLLSLPRMDTSDEKLYNIPGTPPNLIAPIQGDAFAVRNEYALKIDHRLPAPMFAVSETHRAATWLLSSNAPKIEMPAQLKDRIQKMKEEAELC